MTLLLGHLMSKKELCGQNKEFVTSLIYFQKVNFSQSKVLIQPIQKLLVIFHMILVAWNENNFGDFIIE
jgi:hypothetical protein